MGESVANIYSRYQESFAGRLRYEQAHRNLLRLHDLSRPCRVLDAAGGNGINSAFLLAQGHAVTLFDGDIQMLEQARERLGALGLMAGCQLVHGQLGDIVRHFALAQFDLIVCHHVLEYVDDCPQVLRDLGELAAPGGELSVITLNPVSEVIRAIVFQHNPALALAKLTDLQYDARWFGSATLYPEQQVVSWAEQSGWGLRDTRAIRVLADYLPGTERSRVMEEDLLRLEDELAGRVPYRHFGRYLQFAFTKRGD